MISLESLFAAVRLPSDLLSEEALVPQEIDVLQLLLKQTTLRTPCGLFPRLGRMNSSHPRWDLENLWQIMTGSLQFFQCFLVAMPAAAFAAGAIPAAMDGPRVLLVLSVISLLNSYFKNRPQYDAAAYSKIRLAERRTNGCGRRTRPDDLF
jgi:hypothetical protein